MPKLESDRILCKQKRASSVEARLLNFVSSISRELTDELPAFAEKASAGEGGETGTNFELCC